MELEQSRTVTLSLGKLSPSRAVLFHYQRPKQNCNTFSRKFPLVELSCNTVDLSRTVSLLQSRAGAASLGKPSPAAAELLETLPWDRAVSCHLYGDFVVFLGS